MTTVQSIEFMTGLVFLVTGLSYIFCNKVWAAWLELLEEAPHRAALGIGTINLLFGSFILAFHWIWDGPQTVVTVLGVFITLKGMIHLLFPCFLPFKLEILEKAPRQILIFAGLVAAILGAYILTDWVEQPSVKDYWQKPLVVETKTPGARNHAR